MTIPLVIALLSVVSACKPAQETIQRGDFSVLAQPAEGFKQARPGRPLVFPADHGAHPEYRIEWWYLTANLRDGEGRDYGAQWTLFRFAVESPADRAQPASQQHNQLYMAHMAITAPTGHIFFQRYAKGSEAAQPARAGVTSSPFSAWLDDWVLESSGDGWLPLEVRMRQDNTGFRLRLVSDKPLVLQGSNGFSQKHAAGGGSYYYSQPFLAASGVLTLDGVEIAVSGNAWLDREWGSQFLQKDQQGWDWFSLHLDSGEKLMLFQLRQKPGSGTASHFLHGALMDTEGQKTPLDPGQVSLQPVKTMLVSGRELPLAWRIELPGINRQFTLEALDEDQWMGVDFPYWEGVVVVSGDGPGNNGRGYMELTGYPMLDDAP